MFLRSVVFAKDGEEILACRHQRIEMNSNFVEVVYHKKTAIRKAPIPYEPGVFPEVTVKLEERARAAQETFNYIN